MLRRFVRGFAALALVPVVIFSNSVTAHAATSGTLSFSLNGDYNANASCQVSWARTSTGVSVGASSLCQGEADTTPYTGQPFEDVSGSYGFVLKSSSGATCGSAALPARDIPENGLSSVAAGLGAAFAPVTWTSCVPVQACLSYYYNDNGRTVDVVDCVAFPVDPPASGWEPPAEMPYGSCFWGTPQAVASAHVTTYGNNQLVKDGLRLLFYNRYPEPGDPASGLEWDFNVMHGTAPAPLTPPAEPSTNWMMMNATNSSDPNENAQWVSTTLWKNAPTYLGGSHEPGPTGPIYGVQVTTQHSATKTANGGTKIGYTNPGKCSFWFGPKIRATDSAIYGESDPWAPMTDMNAPTPTPTPDPTPPTVTPTPTDAPSTEVGFWGAILGVLRSIWNAITSVVGAIKDLVVGIADKLKDLFIPDSDNWGVSGIRNGLRDKPPFSVAVELKDQLWAFSGAYTGSGECGVLADFGSLAGQPLKLDCAQIKNSPGLGAVYGLVSAGFLGLTAWVGFGMIQRLLQEGS